MGQHRSGRTSRGRDGVRSVVASRRVRREVRAADTSNVGSRGDDPRGPARFAAAAVQRGVSGCPAAVRGRRSGELSALRARDGELLSAARARAGLPGPDARLSLAARRTGRGGELRVRYRIDPRGTGDVPARGEADAAGIRADCGASDGGRLLRDHLGRRRVARRPLHGRSAVEHVGVPPGERDAVSCQRSDILACSPPRRA